MKRRWLHFGLKLISFLALSNISSKKCHCVYLQSNTLRKKSSQHYKYNMPLLPSVSRSLNNINRNTWQRWKGNRDNTIVQAMYLNHSGHLLSREVGTSCRRARPIFCALPFHVIVENWFITYMLSLFTFFWPVNWKKKIINRIVWKALEFQRGHLLTFHSYFN